MYRLQMRTPPQYYVNVTQSSLPGQASAPRAKAAQMDTLDRVEASLALSALLRSIYRILHAAARNPGVDAIFIYKRTVITLKG
jgi:hypothetical protein